MNLDKKKAVEIVRSASTESEEPYLEDWIVKVEHLSQLCLDGISSTHIAFLATSILAKAIDRKVDLFAIKPKHADGNANAYSARSLCHGVLVPLAAELGFSLGVNGREPLNNQPYFRMNRLGDDTPVHSKGRAAFDYMCSLVLDLNQLGTELQAMKVLRAFIAVRRRYQPRYAVHDNELTLTPDKLVEAISQFVGESSEGGRRAQAIVAGLMDIFAGEDRVESGRINDPSRHYPGDVCVHSIVDFSKIEKAIEVRDKPVKESDVQIFGKKCIDMGVVEAALVMVSPKQKKLDEIALRQWSNEFGLSLTLFYGWSDFVNQAMFWSSESRLIVTSMATRFIHKRLVEVEVSPQSILLWQATVAGSESCYKTANLGL